jgi:hypothetical protein
MHDNERRNEGVAEKVEGVKGKRDSDGICD